MCIYFIILPICLQAFLVAVLCICARMKRAHFGRVALAFIGLFLLASIAENLLAFYSSRLPEVTAAVSFCGPLLKMCPCAYILCSNLALFLFCLRFVRRQFQRKNAGLKDRSITGYYLLTILVWCVYFLFVFFRPASSAECSVCPDSGSGFTVADCAATVNTNFHRITAGVLRSYGKEKFLAVDLKSETDAESATEPTAVLFCRMNWYCKLTQSVGNVFLILGLFLLIGTVVEFFRTFWCKWLLWLIGCARGKLALFNVDIYVFSELNDYSLALAKSIRGGLNRERALLIFQNVSSPVFLDSEVRDLRFEALKLGQVVFNPEDITQRGLGVQRSALVTVFFCKRDVNENFVDAATIMEGDRVELYEKCRRVRFHVLSEGASHGRALMSLQKRDSNRHFRENRFSLFLDSINRNAVYHLFDHHPLYLRLEKGHAPAVAVLGSGDVADEIIRTVSWLGIYEKNAKGAFLKPSLDLWDRDARGNLKRLKTVFAELERNFASLKAVNVDPVAEWNKFRARLEAGQVAYSYIILAMPDANLNIRLAMYLRIVLTRMFITGKMSNRDIPQIAVHVTEPCLRKHLLDFYPHKGHEHLQKPYENIAIIPFGCRTGAYSEEAILEGERDAMLYRTFIKWAFETTREKFLRRRDSKKDWDKRRSAIEHHTCVPKTLRCAMNRYLATCFLEAPLSEQSDRKALDEAIITQCSSLQSLQLNPNLDDKAYHRFQRRHLLYANVRELPAKSGESCDAEVCGLLDQFVHAFHQKLNAIPHYRHARARFVHFKYQLAGLGIVSRLTSQLTDRHIQILHEACEKNSTLLERMIRLEYVRWCAFQRSNGFRMVPKGKELIRTDGFKELEAAFDARIVNKPEAIRKEWGILYEEVKRCVETVKATFEEAWLKGESNDSAR